jgi:hypothetical protein
MSGFIAGWRLRLTWPAISLGNILIIPAARERGLLI